MLVLVDVLVLVGVLVLFGVPGVFLASLVFLLAYLVFGGLFGIHYIFFGVIGVCGIGMLYLLHLEFGMVHLFSSQKMLFSE